MRRITGTITVSVALIALGTAAQAGNEGAYTIMPVQTQSVGANYVAPTPSFLPQPTEVMTETVTSETMTTTETVSSGGVGELIYNSEPYYGTESTGETMTYSTDSSGYVTSGDVIMESTTTGN